MASELGYCVYVFMNTISDWAKPKAHWKHVRSIQGIYTGENTYVRTW